MTHEQARIARLERAVRELRDQVDALPEYSADTVTPNYLTQDAQGRVGADFAGHVSALGLDLPAGTTTTPPDSDRVRWLRESDGAAVAYLTAYDLPSALPGDDALEAWCQAVPGGAAGGAAQGVLGVKASTGERAMVYMTHNPAIARKRNVRAFAEDDAGTQFDRLLIDSTGRADFLQLLASGKVAIDYGAVATTYPGGSSNFTDAPVAHLLGRVPAIVLALHTSPGSASAAAVVGVLSGSLTAAGFTLVGGRRDGVSPAAATGVGLAWAAIG